MRRTVSYPDYPKSQLVFDVDVRAVSASEWFTDLIVSGAYDGPTDIVSARDYQVTWIIEGKTLSEKGSATLGLSSGGSVRSTWSSSIVPAREDFVKFPSAAEIVRVSISPFRIDGNRMSYEWKGTVGKRE